MKIGRIVSGWKINFPKTENDPDQFLLILKDLLSTSGINKDMFVPCLSNIFEGAYRQWYLINKRNWQTWREFSKAFRYQWGVIKADGDLFVEIRDLKVEKGESLAEFTCRARFIFERMMHPPTFKEQLKQILLKFNSRITFEILNLPLNNYNEFLHYANERSYLYRRSIKSQREPRPRKGKVDLNYMQNKLSEEEDEPESSPDNEEHPTDLNTFRQKDPRANKIKQIKTDTKPLVRQRLEQNLPRYEKNSKTENPPPVQQDGTRKVQMSTSRDPSQIFCYNCGE